MTNNLQNTCNCDNKFQGPWDYGPFSLDGDAVYNNQPFSCGLWVMCMAGLIVLAIRRPVQGAR